MVKTNIALNILSKVNPEEKAKGGRKKSKCVSPIICNLGNPLFHIA